LMAVLVASTLADASPVRPESPESPVTAVGLASADELAFPVLPVLVAVDWAHAVPESPDWASGASLTHGDPPSPPFASPWAIESPPTTLPPPRRLRLLLRPTLRRPRALPARPDWTRWLSPPRPPSPPSTEPSTSLRAVPVSPEVESLAATAPVLAAEKANPAARALPV